MKRPIRRKTLLRLFSVLFSLLIWLYVISSAEVEVEKVIPLNIELPAQMALATPVKKEVSVFLKGPRVFVRTILDREDKINIKLEDYYKAGEKKYSIGLGRYQIPLPLSVQQSESVPKKIDFTLDKEISRTLPLEPMFDAETMKQYDIKKIKITPERILVTGARSLVKNLKTIPTAIIDKKLFDDAKGIVVGFKSPHENLELSHKEAMVNYTLSSKWTEFTFTKIPIIFHSTKLIKSALPKVVNITLKGERSYINQMNTDLIKVVASVLAKDETKQSVELVAELPEEVELVKIEPESITVVTE